MSERVVSVIRMPAAGPRAVLEVEIVEPAPPGRWRLWLALWLIQWAGKLARMRVRVDR